MQKITKKSFREATKITKVWNRIIEWEGYNIATVMFHPCPWKLVEKNTNWKELTTTYDPNNYTKILIPRRRPIAEFHTQEELWQYIKTLIK